MTASVHSTTGSRNQGWASVISWMFLHRELIERLPEQVRAQMSEWEKKYAESEEANVRIQDLAPSAHRQPSPETKKAVKIVVAAMSARRGRCGGANPHLSLGVFEESRLLWGWGVWRGFWRILRRLR